MPQDASDINSPDWSLVLRLDDRYYLEKDDCGFDIFPDRMELNLKKKKSELWDRMFIGVSESSLKVCPRLFVMGKKLFNHTVTFVNSVYERTVVNL